MSARDGSRWGRELALVPVRWSGLALACGVAAAAMWVEAAVAMLVALAQVVGWRSRLPLPWEIATSLVCLGAALSSYLMLYERITWWDLPVHVALNGLLAVMVARVISRNPSPAPVTVLSTGAILAVVWEVMELGGNRWVDSSIHVPPADTVGDILAGMVGTAAAAALWRRHRVPRSSGGPRVRGRRRSSTPG